METMFWVWLAVLVLAVVIEIVTMDLVSVWFAVGAIVPFILSAVGGIAIEIQVIVFVVISGILIIFIRKIAQKYLFKNMNEKTNVGSLVGKSFRLLESTDFDTNGSLKVNDIIWTAVGEKGETIEKGTLVEIVKVEGNKLLVKKIEEKVEKTEESTDNKENKIDGAVNSSKNEEKA